MHYRFEKGFKGNKWFSLSSHDNRLGVRINASVEIDVYLNRGNILPNEYQHDMVIKRVQAGEDLDLTPKTNPLMKKEWRMAIFARGLIERENKVLEGSIAFD